MGNGKEDVPSEQSDDSELYAEDEGTPSRTIRDWGAPTSALLRKLDEVKPSVYTFSLCDAKNLKANNGRTALVERCTSAGKYDGDHGVHVGNKTAWGSSCSIPDLLKQHHAKTRPESAKNARQVRLPSGRPRPQSANARSTRDHPNKDKLGITVQGTKYDPSGRPPKGASQRAASVGWVTCGHSAAKPTTPQQMLLSAESIPPPPSPQGHSPEALPEEKAFSTFTGEISEINPQELPPHVPEHIHFTLPSAGEEGEEEEITTQRLLEMVSSINLNGYHAARKSPRHTGHNLSTDTERSDRELCPLLDFSEEPLMDTSGDTEEKSFLICEDDFIPDNLKGCSSNRNESPFKEIFTDKGGYCLSPVEQKPIVRFMDSRNVTFEITPRNCLIKESSECSDTADPVGDVPGETVVTVPEKTKTTVCKTPGEGIGLSTEDRLRFKNTSGKKNHFATRPCTPVSLVTMGYAEESSDTTWSQWKCKKNRHEVETMMSKLNFPNAEDCPDEHNNNNLVESGAVCSSAPERNYYEALRIESARKKLSTELSPSALQQAEKDELIAMTTTTLNLGERETTETKTKTLISHAPFKHKSNVTSPAPSIQKTAEVPKLNLKSLEDGKTPASIGVSETRSTSSVNGGKEVLRSMKRPPSGRHSLLRRPRTSSATVNKPLRGSFRLSMEVTPPRRLSASVVLSDSDSDEQGQGQTLQAKASEEDAVSQTKDESILSQELNGTGAADDMLNKKSQEMLVLKNPTQSEKELTSESAPSSHSATAVTQARKEGCSTRPQTAGTVRKQQQHLATDPHGWGDSSKIAAVLNSFGKQSSFSSLLNRHYSSYSRSSSAPVKKRSPKPKVVHTKPAYNIVTKPFDPDHVDVETDEIIECRKLQERLRENGIKVNLHTLKRALLPPDGSTYYYDTTSYLPKSNSYGLLSHPRVWLPEEHKKLQQAKRALARVNEQLWLQKKQEEERETKKTDTANKKTKKLTRGKKGSSKIKRSKSVN